MAVMMMIMYFASCLANLSVCNWIEHIQPGNVCTSAQFSAIKQMQEWLRQNKYVKIETALGDFHVYLVDLELLQDLWKVI